MNCLRAHNVNPIYEAKELNDQEALELFSFHAFKGNIRMDDFFDLLNGVIRYAKGIPLALEVLGSDLCSKNKDEWKDALEYYNRYPNEQIQQALRRSYEALEDPIKQVFLHIACFFKGYKQSYVIDVLQSCDLNPMYCLKVLMEKALIKIAKYNSIWMHDLLEDMGKEIVRQESPDEIGQRSRLWLYEDVCEVLEENTGTDKIKAIELRVVENSQKIRLNGGSFTDLKNLQIFKVDEGMLCGDGVDYFPNQLRVLDWMSCSLRSLPTNFNPRKLVMLHMGGPCTTPIVNEGLKKMRHLKSIKLWGCDGLTRIPDLSGLTCLKELELSHCEDLVEVDPSVGRLDKLVFLKLTHCEKLQMFPKLINLKSLETLDLSDCPLEFFPEIEGDLKSLNHLDLSRTAIKELPCSVGNLTGLKSLDLSHCRNLTNVPSSIFYELQRLERLNLRSCYYLVTFPTKSESLPPPPVFSTNLPRLQVDLNGFCDRLEEISEFPREIDSLYVSGCESLKRISKLSKILEGKDSKMFGLLDFVDCWGLRDNLARRLVSGVEVDKRLFHLAKKRTGKLMEELTSSPSLVGTKDLDELMEEAEKLMEEADEAEELMEKADELMEEEEAEAEADEAEELIEVAETVKLTALLTLFFSCAKSEEFQVRFPARAPIPNWFTRRQEVVWDLNWDGDEDVIEIKNSKVANKEHEFCIEIPQNSNWDNKGLALCIQSNSDDLTHCVYIDGIKFREGLSVGLHEVWVQYIPFVTVRKRLRGSGMPPPDMFRVMFRFRFTGHDYLSHNISGEVSWGVHLIENLEGEGR